MPSYRAAGTYAGGNAISVSPGIPAGTTEGDLLVLFIDGKYGDGSVPVIGGLSGWTELFTPLTSGGNHFFVIYTKLAGASESAPTITGAENSISTQIVAIEPETGGGILSIDTHSTSTSNGVIPGVDPTVTDAFLLLCWGMGVTTALTSPSFDGLTLTERITNASSTTSGLDSGLALWTADAADDAATGDGSATAPGTSVSATVAIKEVPGSTSQKGYATADSVDNNWTDNAAGTALAAAIDETTPSDSDYIQSEFGPVNSACRIKAFDSLLNPESGTRTLRWRAGKNAPSGATINMIVKLYQGGGDSIGGGTLVDSFTRNDVNTATTYEETVTGTITDYADLYVEFWANQP